MVAAGQPPDTSFTDNMLAVSETEAVPKLNQTKLNHTSFTDSMLAVPRHKCSVCVVF